jgi:ATP-dependent protease HslVU (ClpYQ) peptidase subunit
VTTIACDGISMAGDGRTLSANDIVLCHGSPKVLRLKDGSLLGCAGTSDVKHKLRDWLEQGAEGPFPKIKGAFSAMLLLPNGEGRYFNEDEKWIAMEFPFAIGSGSEIALGAMDAGASPEEAVEIACRRDPFSGGAITRLDIPAAEK